MSNGSFSEDDPLGGAHLPGVNALSASDVRSLLELTKAKTGKNVVVRLASCLLGEFSPQELGRGVVFRFASGDTLSMRYFPTSARVVTAVAWNGTVLPYPPLEHQAIAKAPVDAYTVYFPLLILTSPVLLLPSFPRNPLAIVLGAVMLLALTVASLILGRAARKHPVQLARLALALSLLPVLANLAAVYWGSSIVADNYKGMYLSVCVVGYAILIAKFVLIPLLWLYLTARIPIAGRKVCARGDDSAQCLPNWKRARIVDVPDVWGKCLLCGWIVPLETYPEGSQCPNCWGQRRGPLDAVAKCEALG
ncbi:MAG: hypothetical protein WC655_11765 [Candidatus Hydrogenedentales bacterium]